MDDPGSGGKACAADGPADAGVGVGVAKEHMGLPPLQAGQNMRAHRSSKHFQIWLPFLIHLLSVRQSDPAWQGKSRAAFRGVLPRAARPQVQR